ncbi:MAG: polyprenyl synthetase family protein [Planctomycetes bacterium]|nr:polyprenyl synthetase family protein [Planctomycetota bacterium]
MQKKAYFQGDFGVELAEMAGKVNETLADVMGRGEDIHQELKYAMNYTLTAPGKRIRAAVVMWTCKVIAGQVTKAAQTAAAAVEMVHTYSLVHDDLPAMDDDDIRRGLATCHKEFGEAEAILTGDALLTMAFEILASDVEDDSTAKRMIVTLARAAGSTGMIAGQMADFKGEDTEGDLQLLEYIHTNKTAKMFAAATTMGGIAGGANDEQILKLYNFGLGIGLGFQIADDILDMSASSEDLGKTAGKDATAGKITYPSVVGLDKSKQILGKITEDAVAALEEFGPEADILRQLAVELLNRTR